MSGVILDQLVNEPSHESRADPFAGVNPAIHENCVLPPTTTSVRVRNGDDGHIIAFVTSATAAHLDQIGIGCCYGINKLVNLILEKQKENK